MNTNLTTLEVTSVLPNLCTVDIKSYAPEVFVDDQWSRNRLRFETSKEAEAYAHDLFMRWMLCIDSRAAESEDEPTHRYLDGRLTDIIRDTGPAK
jgi:hypothetical protein